MKKKFLLSVLTLFIFSVFMVSVNAAGPESALGITYEIKAKTPDSVPAVGSQMYGTVTNKFDLSKITFNTSTGSTEAGETNLRKIIVGNLNATEAGTATSKTTDAEKLAAAFSKWYTAYCLDGTQGYPSYGIYSNENYVTSYIAYQTAVASSDAAGVQTNAVGMLNSIVRAAILNDSSVQDKIKNVTGHVDSVTINMMTGDYTLVDKEVATALSDLNDNTKTIPQRSFKVNVNKITFMDSDTMTPTVIEFSNYELTVSPINILFDKYVVNDSTDKVSTNSKSYTKALWIIEHTYPSLDIETALTEAGVNYDTLKTQIATLYSKTEESDITVFTENAVYGTIQYAIWSVTGGSPKGTVFTGVANSTELDTLFKYLVQDRTIPNEYASGMSFKNTLEEVRVGDGKELVGEENGVYKYGPYSAKYDALDGENINVTITTEDADGVKIVDKDGNEITEIEPGQEFYILIPKKAKLGNVTIKLDAKVSVFVPDGLRGRIYQPIFVLGQNVMSGGKIDTKTISAKFDVTINAKTGVEDIAVLLMVTLVAFSLGYLVLSYKAKPVELN